MEYYVYVIRLDKSVLQSKKFLRCNPELNPNLPCYYIGQSAQPPEVRFWQHKQGYKSNRFAKKYGLGLCPQYYSHLNPISSRKKAEDMEKRVTEILRNRGNGVWSN